MRSSVRPIGQEPSEELAAKTAQLRDKLVKLESEMQRLAAMDKLMLANNELAAARKEAAPARRGLIPWSFFRARFWPSKISSARRMLSGHPLRGVWYRPPAGTPDLVRTISRPLPTGSASPDLVRTI